MKNFLMLCQILFLVMGFLGVGTATGGILEGPTQNPANSHTYYLLEPNITWTQAEAEAISLGGHLVTINDAAEQAWVWSTFGEGKNRWLWIGINDLAVEGSFVWVSGEAVTYTNWAPGEPNDGGTGEDYGEMDFSMGGKWNDLPNDGWIYRHYGVVEIDDVPTCQAEIEINSYMACDSGYTQVKIWKTGSVPFYIIGDRIKGDEPVDIQITEVDSDDFPCLCEGGGVSKAKVTGGNVVPNPGADAQLYITIEDIEYKESRRVHCVCECPVIGCPIEYDVYNPTSDIRREFELELTYQDGFEIEENWQQGDCTGTNNFILHLSLATLPRAMPFVPLLLLDD